MLIGKIMLGSFILLAGLVVVMVFVSYNNPKYYHRNGDNMKDERGYNCPPCTEEMTYVQYLHGKTRTQGAV